MCHGGSSECVLTSAGRWCICWQVPAGHRYSLDDGSKVMEENCRWDRTVRVINYESIAEVYPALAALSQCQNNG